MAIIEDYILCALALAALVWETWMIAKRNRTIKVKGKDDFFTFCIVMMFAMLFLRPEIDVDMLTSLRNTLILMALFFSLAIKRGISERGVEKICFVIPWDKIETIGGDAILVRVHVPACSVDAGSCKDKKQKRSGWFGG